MRHRLLVGVDPGERVLHPVDVVALGKILARMRAAAFVAVARALHRDHRLHDQVVVFERLDQVGVPDQRAVGDARRRRRRARRRGSSSLPSASISPVRNTAQLFCMMRCMARRSCAVGVLPLALRNRSRRDSARSALSFGSSAWRVAGASASRRRAGPRRGRTRRGRSANWSRGGWRRAPRRRPPRRAPSGPARSCRDRRPTLVSTSP